jgi:hypothetical protein
MVLGENVVRLEGLPNGFDLLGERTLKSAEIQLQVSNLPV